MANGDSGKGVEWMELPGGCQCGAVRYILDCVSITPYACHCRECQKQSASAFAISVPVWSSQLSLSGPLKSYKRPTDSGTYTNCCFCENCGTRIYHQSARSPDILTLKGGTLDAAAELRPVAHLWVSRMQPWWRLPEDAVTFDTQPDDLRTWRDGFVTASFERR